MLLSSHLLVEVEQVCDRVGLLHRGRLVAEGAPGELTGAATEVIVRAEPLPAAVRCLTGHPAVESVTAADGVLRVVTARAQTAEINRALVAVSELRVGGGLEELLLGLDAQEVAA
ncbi:hypothetical protein [Pseudonocardia nigra]|uniref:hypothetical protein n=1 Tax=Pseudonocardia nigra TaxID=1921578 RepID=UPI001FE5A397|nr:hypothetical protein [Pseudonocardia nigra]